MDPAMPNERLARELVTGRAMGRCELCRRPANNFAHRVGRGQGGLWIASNGVLLCGSGTTGCHGWTTHEPVLAEAGGWRIESTGLHPTEVEVWLHHAMFGPGWWLLDDDGCCSFGDDAPPPALPPWAVAA